jgi:cellulose synthase/poly-beta-1,6-N-acetylglucosamine synthase-like glycosyltransferase
MLVIILPLIFALWYLVALLYLRRGLARLPTADSPSGHSFSVVIAARNEESVIGECLETILRQSIPPERFEVIVVDDRSEDRTAEVVERMASEHRNLRCVQIEEVPPGISPKKHAVAAGVSEAIHPIIVCTDADCRVPSTWLETVDRYMTDDTGLVQGMTSYRFVPGMSHALYRFQSIDFLSHGVIAAAAIGADLPLNANGNNIAYRREAFEEGGGYGGDDALLGDDDLLLQRVWHDGRWKVRYMGERAGAVETTPTTTVGEMIRQRARWGSVSVHYGFRQIALLAGLFLFYCSIPVTLALGVSDPLLLLVCLGMLTVKLAGEYLMLIPGTRLFDRTELLRILPLASLVHLPLVLYAVFAGVFGKHEWKGTVSRHAVDAGK